ncbi:hypothetical protein K474DRAFT_1773824 [Panus rudis PR-1116 ss-1]|nr:hypothetical protein K474DRAFT_1773824 [Panus rudis PR-1116 ss-1]
MTKAEKQTVSRGPVERLHFATEEENLAAYARHQAIAKESSESLGGRVKCPACRYDKILANEQSFAVHLRRHHGLTPFKCEMCDLRRDIHGREIVIPCTYATGDQAELHRHKGKAHKEYQARFEPYPSDRKTRRRRAKTLSQPDSQREFSPASSLGTPVSDRSSSSCDLTFDSQGPQDVSASFLDHPSPTHPNAAFAGQPDVLPQWFVNHSQYQNTTAAPMLPNTYHGLPNVPISQFSPSYIPQPYPQPTFTHPTPAYPAQTPNGFHNAPMPWFTQSNGGAPSTSVPSQLPYPIRPAAPFNVDTRQDPMFAFDQFLAGPSHSQGYNQIMANYDQPSGSGLTNAPFDPFNAYQVEPTVPQGTSLFTQSDLEAFRDLVSTMPSLS